jgi:hypothetical protein
MGKKYKQIDTSHQYVVIDTGYTYSISKDGDRGEKFFKSFRLWCEPCVELLFIVDKDW